MLETDITIHQEQIDALSNQAEDLIKGRHFDAEGIKMKKELLISQYQALQVPLKKQKECLAASSQLQQFLRDIDDEEAWIKERDSIASLSNRGMPVAIIEHTCNYDTYSKEMIWLVYRIFRRNIMH